MHGYQLMQAIAERSGGSWTPSPGAIYPTISQLEDEGLVTVTADAGRKLVTLTDAGREHVEARRGRGPTPSRAHPAAGPGTDLRGLLEELHAAVRQVARTGSDAQVTALPASSPRPAGRSTCCSRTGRTRRAPDRARGQPRRTRPKHAEPGTAGRGPSAAGGDPFRERAGVSLAERLRPIAPSSLTSLRRLERRPRRRGSPSRLESWTPTPRLDGS